MPPRPLDSRRQGRRALRGAWRSPGRPASGRCGGPLLPALYGQQPASAAQTTGRATATNPCSCGAFRHLRPLARRATVPSFERVVEIEPQSRPLAAASLSRAELRRVVVHESPRDAKALRELLSAQQPPRGSASLRSLSTLVEQLEDTLSRALSHSLHEQPLTRRERVSAHSARSGVADRQGRGAPSASKSLTQPRPSACEPKWDTWDTLGHQFQ